jgi:TPP-dependent pyruvate/acetoin dehydrogenase alpha subunit
MAVEATRPRRAENGLQASASDLIDLLKTMWTVRAFEEKVSELYAKAQIAGLLHLGIGQEGSSVGACSVLRREDYVFGGHRAHPHIIAKGADIDALFAELAGRATGLCRGKGGSMHVAAKDVGFITATGIVGGCIPLALGGGLVAREHGDGRVAAVFFGDGAGQAGVFHESLNIAALWKLPVIFVCENNGYAEFTPLSAHTLVDRLANYAKTYGMPNEIVDGNDVLAVRGAMAQAVERARAGDGPSFVECITYRMRGHYEGDGSKYREHAEQAEWKAKDPIARFERVLAEKGFANAKKVTEVQRAAREAVSKAAAAALAAPWPGLQELTEQVYAGD